MTSAGDGENRAGMVEVLAAGGSGVVAIACGGRLYISSIETSVMRVCGAAVSSGNPLLVCAITLEKSVIVLAQSEGGTWDEVAKHSLPKRPTDVCFSPAGKDVVVSDAFGDVYKLPVNGSVNVRNDSMHEEMLLLGHVSTVTTVDVCSSLVATADRDNKLRISGFPHAFIVQSFCFGHEQFITCVRWISEKRLLSGAGDGTLRLWNAQDGQPLASIRICDAIPEGLQRSMDSDVLLVVSSIDVARGDPNIAAFTVHDRPWLFLITGLDSSGQIHVSKPIELDETCTITGIAFDAECTLWVSFASKRKVSNYEVNLRDSAARAPDLRLKGSIAISINEDEKAASPEASPPREGAHIIRFDWLAQQRKKDMVSDWKGKKRKHKDI